MERRVFLKLSGAAGLATCLPLSCLSPSRPTYKLGYQLYSIRDEMSKDPIATLEALKEMGYEDFEHYGFSMEYDTYYGYPTAEFKKVMDNLGLTISSGHYPFIDYYAQSLEALAYYVNKCIEGALTMGSHYLTWPMISLPYRTVDGYKALAEEFNKIGEQVKKAGLGFAYHNHGYEFADLNGTNGFEIITSETDPELVKLQMDMYWVVHEGKTTPSELVKKHPGRFVMWHIKDMHKVSMDYTELGNGSIDYPSLLPDPTLSGLEYFYIEQGGNFTENSLKSAATSAAYFKETLRQYL